MLLFILFDKKEQYYILLFQYISCYCLSNIERDIDVEQLYFNTSHVTVYQNTLKTKFQQVGIFQYISCYCLSMQPYRERIKTKYFNTSHVTVYPRKRSAGK